MTNEIRSRIKELGNKFSDPESRNELYKIIHMQLNLDYNDRRAIR